MIPALPVLLVSLVYPLLTVAAFWAIVVWALKHGEPITLVVRALTDPERQEKRDASSADSPESERRT